MDDLELAYLAGAVDSDGWIGIVKHDPNRPSKRRCASYCEAITFAQTGPTIPEMLKARFGGHVQYRIRRGDRAKNWRPMYYWNGRSKIAARAVAALRPYLKIKARQADLVLELRASKDLPFLQRRTTVVAGARSRATNPDVIAHRAFLCAAAQTLNRTGVEGPASASDIAYRLTG